MKNTIMEKRESRRVINDYVMLKKKSFLCGTRISYPVEDGTTSPPELQYDFIIKF